MDFFDDLGLGGERGAAGVGVRQLISGLVHDFLHIVEQLDDFRHRLLDGELLYVCGKLVLLVGDLDGTLAVFCQHIIRNGDERETH